MVFKGSLYILNLLCGIIPCEHKYQYPDTSPSDSLAFNDQVYVDNESDVSATINSTAWNNGTEDLFRDLDYNKTHPLVVNTATGMVMGYWMRVVGGRKIRAFEGIPYAQPPMNELRFKAPLPVKPWNGLLHANIKGPKCLQYNDITVSRVIGSENCLFLNIFAPPHKRNSTSKYPVLVYIHGGGYCKLSSGRHFRHNELNKIIQQSLSSIKVSSRLEPNGLFRDDGKRPDGITNIPWEKDRALVWDATCVDTFAKSYMSNTDSSPGHAAEEAAKKKHKKYSTIKADFNFVAFSVETIGLWSSEAIDLVNKIGSQLNQISGDNRSRNYLIQRISLAIQRGNSCSILGTLPTSTPLDEILYL